MSCGCDRDSSATYLSLFSGVAGLDVGLGVARPGWRCAGYVEREGYAASILMARMEDAALDAAPVVWGDIQDVDFRMFAGVDYVVGGFPCQDISLAGKGAGIDGERSGLWREFARAIRETGARGAFIENVAALRSRGLDRVLRDLAALGFDAEWVCLRASDVGAPHRRERVFILAHASRDGQQRNSEDGVRGQNRPDANRCGGEAADVEHASCNGRVERRPESARVKRRLDAAEYGGAVEYPISERLEGQLPAGTAPWTALGTGGVFPPGPGDRDAWRAILDHSPHLAPAVESGVRVMVDGMAVVVDQFRADQLRCIGNGVVPLQAAVAFELLHRRLHG